ncbi:MAG: BrnA antitoxin family protein [Terriglobia bacterium]
MKGKKKLKAIPEFKSESEERDFWAHEDSTDYIDWTQAERAVFPDLKPSTRTISLRLPVTIIGHLKLLANKRDIPYQSLLKVFLAERLDREIVASRPPTSGRRKRRGR